MILPALVLLAACGGGGLEPLPQPQMHAGFPKGGVADVIRVDALDPQPLRAAELIAPDGGATPANWVNVIARPQVNGGPIASSNLWRNDLSGTGGTASLFNGTPDAAFRTHTELLLTASAADIPLPDPTAYRRDWEKYRIRLTFGGEGEPQTREIPAPEPPPMATPSG